ncbi:unnamed protein product [Lactuca saligna]|uniref:Uncharacterized protein n=1 Tax=Lactuca saligna TaxID=75948 RepID=A0AA35Y985_LACSI|nr:unnamed protein product [Lactuca saligna]
MGRLNLCARLFDGNSATGNFRSYSTQSSSVAGASSYRLPPLQITATPFHAIDDDGEHTSHHEPPPSAASPSAASPSAAPPFAASPSTASPYTASPSGNPNKRAKPSTPIPPSASPSAFSPDGTSITGDDLALEMKKALQSLTKGYTIPQCLEKLEPADVKKQTVFLLQTADVWSTSSAAEACRCGPQTADILASEKQTAP